MARLEYQGRPMSACFRAGNVIVKGDEPLPRNNWLYMPAWPGGFLDGQEWTPEREQWLQEEGYQEHSHDFNLILASQGFEFQSCHDGTGNNLRFWHRGVTSADQAPPVLLCFPIDNPVVESDDTLPLLNPLPLPQQGTRALVFGNGVHYYRIEDMPAAMQGAQQALRLAIEALGTPPAWPAFSLFYEAASDTATYHQWLADYRHRQELLAGSNSPERQEAMLGGMMLQAARTNIEHLQEMLQRVDFAAKWREIQVMLLHLANLYHTHHQEQTHSSHDLAGRFSLVAPTEPAPPIINPFTEGRALISSAGPFQALIESVQNAAAGADRWQAAPGKPPFYVHARQAGQAIVEYGRREEITVLDESATRGLWQEVKTLDDYDADVLMGIFAQVIKQDGAPAWFWIGQFLDNRGIVPITKQERGTVRRAGHRTEDIDRVRGAIYRLANLWIRIEERRPPRRKGKRERVFVHHGRVFTIDQTWTQETMIDSAAPGAPPIEHIPVALHIVPGTWLQEYLDAPRMVAFLADKILQYDPYREFWEKRLARYFMFHLRINAKHNEAIIKRRIGLLFHDLSLPTDGRNPERTRARFEKAMNRLVEDKQIDAWQYCNASPLPARRWLDQWLETSIEVYAQSRRAIESQGHEETP